jgi:hypothetical protein
MSPDNNRALNLKLEFKNLKSPYSHSKAFFLMM